MARPSTLDKRIGYKHKDIYGRWELVTPHDTFTIEPPRGLIVTTTAGNITMKDKDDNSITIAVVTDVFYKFSPDIIMATGTTAVGIVALY